LSIFDYYLSLIYYFSKTLIQRLANCFYACLFKLFRFDFTYEEMDEINNYLEKYNLFGYQHRKVLRLSLLGHKIENIPNAPPLLKEQLLYSNIPRGQKRRLTPPLFLFFLFQPKVICIPLSVGKFNQKNTLPLMGF
jgi:hypothetical protein